MGRGTNWGVQEIIIDPRKPVTGGGKGRRGAFLDKEGSRGRKERWAKDPNIEKKKGGADAYLNEKAD